MAGAVATIGRPGPGRPANRLLAIAGPCLFMATFLFFWVTVSPFVDLTGEAVLDPSAGNSNRLNQIVSLLLFAGTLAYGLAHPMRHVILQPRLLVGLLFCWFLAVSLLGAHPMFGIKATVLAVIVTINAGIYLLLPASERQFAKMLGIGTLIALGLSYYGILFKPELAIHQASELREPMNAGLWRGHFPHKNSAAAAMVVASFFGLFVWSMWSRLAGAAILGLACLFLVHTGGKTSSAMLPATLLVAFAFERFRFLRIPIVVGGLALFNFLAIGSAAFRPLGEFVAGLGIDATFTNRADIWRFAASQLAERPLTGYGIKAFWQTSALVHGGGTLETWAVAAANGHNSYLDIALTAGIPGLVLTLIWLVGLPLRHIARLPAEAQRSPLTRLYVRIWLYALFNACLESLFFEGGNMLWFTMLVAIYGFSLQGSAILATASHSRTDTMVPHAQPA